MGRTSTEEIEKLLEKEKREIHDIDSQVHILREGLLERTPSKFGAKDIARSFFGALVVAFTFVLKGSVVRTSIHFTKFNSFAILFVSVFLLVIEIYYFGYRKIKDKSSRKLGQFIMKRLPTSYLISLIVSAGLVFLYGLDHDPLIMSSRDIINVIIAISLPASIGAGFSDLLKKY